MSDLDRVKKLAGLEEGGYVDPNMFKDRDKGKITGYRSPAQKRIDDLNLPDNWLRGGNMVRKEQPGPYRTFPPPSSPEMNPSLGAGKPFMSSEEYAREMLKGMKGAPKPGTAEYEKMIQQLTDPSLGAGFIPGKGFAKADPGMNRELTKDRPMEAVGQAAEIFYEMQDMYAGGECPSKPHETIIDELVRFLSGDQLEDFVMTFRRHHMDLGDEMFQDDVDLDVESVEESNDLKELKTLAGVKTEDKYQLPPVDADAIIKRGKENQLIGKYRPPGSPRDPEVDAIISRRAKELEDDPRLDIYRGDDPEIINTKGLGVKQPEKKPFPGFKPGMAINLDAFKDRDAVDPKKDIKDRIDRFKGRDDLRQFQFGKIK